MTLYYYPLFAVELKATISELVTYDNETDVEMQCEMFLYLHPDQNLQWFKGGERIVTGTDRYKITFQDGQLRGQSGGNNVGSSRVSTLAISKPQQSDSGTYTCSIINTNQTYAIQLTVQKGKSALHLLTESVEFRFIARIRALVAICSY